jgi:uncharacterized membrane protein YjgN (DUF898 family)
MTGSGVSYAWRAGLWALLTVLTLGLALPWARAALERYKMRHTAYGDLQGRFVATGGQLFRRGWWLWLLAWPSLVVVIPLPFIYAAFKAIEWRWWVCGIRMGEVSFQSDLSAGALVDLYWKVIGWAALFMLGLSMWFAVAVGLGYASTDPSAATEERVAMAFQQLPVLVASFIGYIAVALASGAVMRVYLMRDIWQRVADSITVQNLAAAENVEARGDTVSALGEGFANSLDVTGL